MIFEENMLKHCYEFERTFRMNKLGIFQLGKKEIADIDIATNEKRLCFGMVDENVWLSRGKGYYCSGITIKLIRDIQEALNTAANKKYKSLIYALNEFLLNHFAVYWNELRFNRKKQDFTLACRLFQQMKYMTSNLLNALFNTEKYYNIDWELLIFVVCNVDVGETDFRVPEYDNKVDVVKEISWLLHSNVMSEVDVIIFPMFGAFYIMLFISVILEWKDVKKECYPINISFHDQIYRKQHEISELNLQGRRVLILDDNIGSGNTVEWCKTLVKHQGGRCITRVCEIPWDVYCKMNKYDVIYNNLDMPTVKSNFRILSKNIFINGIVTEDYEKIFKAEHLYIKEDEELKVMYKRIIKLREVNQFSSAQLENMRNEFDFYEKTLRIGEKSV